MAFELETLQGKGVWFRQVPAGSDPQAEPTDPADNRWQRGSVVGALYLADSAETAWAEWYRSLAAAGLPPARLLPRELWRWELELERLADLTALPTLRRLGLSLPRPTAREWPPFQEVGCQLWRAGYRGLVAPSAARPEGRITCLFRTGSPVPGCSPIPPPRLASEPPPVPKGLRT